MIPLIARLAMSAVGYALVGAALVALIAVQPDPEATPPAPARHEAVLP